MKGNVKPGIAKMRLAELVDGGVIRSLGGWSEVKKIWFKGQDLTGLEELKS